MTTLERYARIQPSDQVQHRADSSLFSPWQWPGLSCSISETQALVTLSTTNGNGVAYLLGTHKSQMGIRTIDRVNIFNCPTRIGFDPSKGQLRQEYSSDSETEADMIPTWCIYLHAVNGPLPNF